MRGKVHRLNERKTIKGFLFRPRWLPLYGRVYWFDRYPRQFRWLEKSSIVRRHLAGFGWQDFCWAKEDPIKEDKNG